MPAGAWAVPFAVGKSCHREAMREKVRSLYPELRGDMAGQASGRIDDTLLVREAQRGNRAAFEELVRHYDHAVLRLAIHLTGSEHEAQDVYQEAFLKAYKSIGNFRFECSFYTWIYRIVTNLCLDAVDPSVKGALKAKIADALVRLQESFLVDILGFGFRAGEMES